MLKNSKLRSLYHPDRGFQQCRFLIFFRQSFLALFVSPGPWARCSSWTLGMVQYLRPARWCSTWVQSPGPNRDPQGSIGIHKWYGSRRIKRHQGLGTIFKNAVLTYRSLGGPGPSGTGPPHRMSAESVLQPHLWLHICPDLARNHPGS